MGKPREERILAWIEKHLKSKKVRIMEEHGFFRTLNGGWSNNHFHLISREEYASLSADELKARLSER